MSSRAAAVGGGGDLATTAGMEKQPRHNNACSVFRLWCSSYRLDKEAIKCLRYFLHFLLTNKPM